MTGESVRRLLAAVAIVWWNAASSLIIMSDRPLRILVKRVYDPPSAADGARVLVDRLWPRGLTRDAAHIDLWLKDVAPSEALRRWFGHEPTRFAEFARRYREELQQLPQATLTLRRLAEKGPVTLLYGAKDREHNQAVVLADWFRGKCCTVVLVRPTSVTISDFP